MSAMATVDELLPRTIPADADTETLTTTFAPVDRPDPDLVPGTAPGWSAGVKHDSGKPRTDLITWEGFSGVPQAVWAAASKSYHDLGPVVSVCFASACLANWWSREKEHQLESSAACCVAALQHFLTSGQPLRPGRYHPLEVLSGTYAVAMLSLGEVLAFGARKYVPRNWEKGIQYSRVYAAAMRHLLAFQSGEALDPETRLPHLAHALCCLMFLLTFEARGLGPTLDDRPTAGGA